MIYQASIILVRSIVASFLRSRYSHVSNPMKSTSLMYVRDRLHHLQTKKFWYPVFEVASVLGHLFLQDIQQQPQQQSRSRTRAAIPVAVLDYLMTERTGCLTTMSPSWGVEEVEDRREEVGHYHHLPSQSHHLEGEDLVDLVAHSTMN